MGAAFLVACQAGTAEKARLFFTTAEKKSVSGSCCSYRSNLWRVQTEQHWGLDPMYWVWGDVVLLTAKGAWRSSCGTADANGTKGCQSASVRRFPRWKGSWRMKPWLTGDLWRRLVDLRIALFTKLATNWNISRTIESERWNSFTAAVTVPVNPQEPAHWEFNS